MWVKVKVNFLVVLVNKVNDVIRQQVNAVTNR